MMATTTPLMQQYYAIKQKHAQDVLLFRVGDFYETFAEDAHKVSEILNIALTKRANGAAAAVALAGFPHHAFDTYVPKLVAAGLRVAVCEQLEDPSQAQGVVKRGVTKLITPGLIAPDLVNATSSAQHHFLAALYVHKQEMGLALLDFSTGDFFIYQGSVDAVRTQLSVYQPVECLFSTLQRSKIQSMDLVQCPTHAQADWIYTLQSAQERLLRYFGTQTLKGFGIASMTLGQVAACAILQYLEDTQHVHKDHIISIQRLEEPDHLWMDGFTIRSLELVQPMYAGAKTLFDILNQTQTVMGARCLRRWLVHPLKAIPEIEARQSMVQWFVDNQTTAQQCASALEKIGDLSRLIGRLACKSIRPKELLKLAQCLHITTSMIEALPKDMPPALQTLKQGIDPCTKLMEQLFHALHDDPASRPAHGAVLNPNAYAKVKELTDFINAQRGQLLDIQIAEAQRTGITSLKIGHNKVFGFYLEVRNTHKERVPKEWIRKQTLVGAERYITADLKGYEERIMSAEETLVAEQETLYDQLIADAMGYIVPLRQSADKLAQWDVLVAWAHLATTNHYTKPLLQDTDTLTLIQARHPVIEACMPAGKTYVPNDLHMDPQQGQVFMITGPNMSGKSALLRMSALVVVLAQIGCFVPAQSATIGVMSKLFSRVGAGDNLTQGESTFMVEMMETANILHNLSGRCLILMDEIGRGTSTYDGISIAWAIVEHVHRIPSAYMLFATHYHELSLMSTVLKGIKNHHVMVKEEDGEVIFLYRLQAGSTQHSFGLHVARMSGVPNSVLSRAYEVLRWLETAHSRKSLRSQLKKTLKDQQTGLF